MSKDQLRSSQIVTTFGPGAMVDLPDSSVIIAGLDHWRYEYAQIQTIEEPRLVAKLKHILSVPDLTLRKPPPATDDHGKFHPSIVAWRFPEWFIVQNMEPTRPSVSASSPTDRGHRRRRLVHLNLLDGGQYRGEDKKKHPVVAVRFVRACHRGHVGDIEWKAFVHGAGNACARDLWLEERGTSGDLDEIWVVCDCGAERAMSQAARKELKALGHCDGSRLWLGPATKERCGDPNKLLIRAASNAYFPQLMSVISIPDTRSPVDDLVRALWDDFLSDVEILEQLVKVRQKPTVANRLQGVDDPTVMDSILRVRSGGGGQDRPVKEVEFEALAEAKGELGANVPEGAFYARALGAPDWSVAWMSAVERVVLVHRLREVVAQVGFTRFEAAGPDIQGELEIDVKRAPLSLDARWVPAAENRGEGVFLQFKSEAVEAWLQRPPVQERGRQLLEGFEVWKAEHEGAKREFSGLPYYMLHSVSHLLLTAISLECGYPASSLRERVYAAPGRYGILIYTGSSDAEGTLGGLVLAGREIARHFLRALEAGALCSNDPVCACHVPAAHDHQPLNGSACHGCLLISETSCEQRNEFLDRALVVPTVEALACEFFSGAGIR